MLRRVVPDVVCDQDLLTLSGADTVREAAMRMRARGVRSVLVVEDGLLAGIFTGTDLIERVVAAGLDPATTPLAKVMTPNPETVAPETLGIEALRMMNSGRYRHLPVTDSDGRPVAVLSRRDFRLDEEDELEREERLWERL